MTNDIRSANDDINRVLLLSAQSEIGALKSKLEDYVSEVAALKQAISSNIPLPADGQPSTLKPSASTEELVLQDLVCDVLEETGDSKPYALPQVIPHTHPRSTTFPSLPSSLTLQ